MLRFNLPEAEELYAELAPIDDRKTEWTPDQPEGGLIRRRNRRDFRDCKVPILLADVGIAAKDLNRLAEDAMKQTRLLVNNPREVISRTP